MMSAFACCMRPSNQRSTNESSAATSSPACTSLPSTFISTNRVAFHSLLQKLR
jgi:hypothetical protein